MWNARAIDTESGEIEVVVIGACYRAGDGATPGFAQRQSTIVGVAKRGAGGSDLRDVAARCIGVARRDGGCGQGAQAPARVIGEVDELPVGAGDAGELLVQIVGV